MKIGGLDFPRPILNALRDDKLVVFAGAGVSMGKPASLPSFTKLAKAIAKGTGVEKKKNEPEDRFLGRLKHQGVDVHKIAAEVLNKNCCKKIPKPTDLHRDLLKLHPESMAPRIVTTNFDTLFEQAGDCSLVSQTEVFTSPALPLGGHFTGIVHVHGALSRPQDIVLTDADFGRAYLTEGWARRFLVDVFRSYTVLFVGYSHSDTIMNYLSRALPADQTESRFVLTHETDDNNWQYLGIEPITYVKSSDNDHSALYRGVNGLAKNTRRSILDWRREITEIAANPPPLDEEEIDIIDDALRDPVKTRFFTAAAVSIEWVDWLDKRNHLAGLFGTSELSERDGLLVQWLAEKFAYRHPDELFLMIGRRYEQPHPKFWDALCRNVALRNEPASDAHTLSRWVSLLLVTAPAGMKKEHPLLWLGEYCVKSELFDRAVDVFDAMAASQLVVKRGFSSPDSDEEEQSPRIDVELGFVSDPSTIKKLWINNLKPNLDRVAEPLLTSVFKHLEVQYRTFEAWQKATRDWSPASFSRSAIEPHEQDEYPKTIDVLIDAARDCLEWLAKNNPKVAASWCNQLVHKTSPLLRRLAVHTLCLRPDLNPNEKIDWLLNCMNLNDISAHHELFQFMKSTYPKADEDHRRSVIEAIQANCQQSPEHENTEEVDAAYDHFTWLHWLHNAAPDCRIAKADLEDILMRNPKFKPRAHPDLTHWMSSVPGGHQSPWTVGELLSKPAEEWADELLSFQDTGINEPDRLGLDIAVSDAAKRDFQWGLDLADAVAKRRNWDTDLWNTLMRLWSETELDEIMTCNVLKRLERNDLHEKYARPIADFLFTLVRDRDTQLVHKLLPQANEIATNLRRHLKPEPVVFHFEHWLTRARNHTAGILAYFWLHSLENWRNHQDPKPDVLKEVYRTALSDIVRDDTVLGRLGRSVLARYFSFLLTSDEEWTKSNLLPLFSDYAESGDYLAVWDGFLYGNLSSSSAELMKDALLGAVSRIVNDPLGERQKSFMRRYVTLLTYFVEDPQEVWIPRLFAHADESARCAFAWHIDDRLSNMSGLQQQEWWDRWLKKYWANRLNGVPRSLNSDEVEAMFRWLPNLESVFVEAVTLAVGMPTDNVKHDGEVLYRIRKSDLCENHPESVAKLLIFLEHISSESYASTEERELIGILREANIPDKLKLKLQELAARRGYT